MEPEKIEALMTFLQAAGQRERLHILGILAERATAVPELARRVGVKETAVVKHINRLKQANLVTETAPYTYQLNQDGLEQLNRTVFHRGDSQSQETLRQRVLRHYTDGPRLKQLPENAAELREIAGWLADLFETGVAYPEKEVNARVEQAHPDFAELRRLMVDFGFMTRSWGVYQKVERTS
jgi:biotin operon repressor